MIRLISRILLVTLLGLSPAPAALADVVHGQGILWQIERDDTEPSWLFGTMHADDDRILELPEPVMERFTQAERYLFEIDFAREDLATTAMRMFHTDGRRLRDQLGEQTWQRAVDAAAQRDIPEMLLDGLKPWALATILTIPQIDPDQMLDKQLHNRTQAEKRNRSVEGLETGDEQLAIFDNLPEERQIRFLEQALDYAEAGHVETQYDALVELYLERDLAGMVALADRHPLLPGDDENRSLMRQLVDDRNRIMVTRMQNDLAQGSAFIAVGALHLPGENGILRLLERRNYTVTPLY